jgi:hypothetical protein
MRTYNNFRLEISRLRQLYFTAKYATNETASSISTKLRSGQMDGNAKLYFEGIEDDRYLIAGSIFAVGHRLRRQLPRYLRELIFIRTISALEVFLIDSIPEVFEVTKEPFKRDYVVEIPQGELLSADSLSEIFTKLINKECRSLHGGGFNEIRKYYAKTFGINFADYCELQKLQEYHDRRHLLVHGLGRTDLAYRKRYDTKIKKLTVDETYLLESMDDLFAFATNINEQFDQRLTGIRAPSTKQPVAYNCTVVVTLDTNSGRNLVLPTCEIWMDNRLISLHDILASSTYIDEKTVELYLQGDKDIIKNYVKRLKQYEKLGELTILYQKSKDLKPSKLSTEDMDKIRASLPAKPWPVSVHREIAEKLGLKASEVYKAIDLIDGESSTE